MPNEKRSRPPKVLHVYRFKERYELDGYERKTALEFTREFTNSGGTKCNEASDYHQQLNELRALAGESYYEMHGIFVAIRTMAAGKERVLRGYLVDSKLEPLTEKRLALRLQLPVKRLRAALNLLIEVNLVERISCPDFAALQAADSDSEKVSEDSEEVSNPYRKGNGKGKKNGNGTGNNKSNRKKKQHGHGQNQEQGKAGKRDAGERVSQEQTAATPATSPPDSPGSPPEATEGEPLPMPEATTRGSEESDPSTPSPVDRDAPLRTIPLMASARHRVKGAGPEPIGQVIGNMEHRYNLEALAYADEIFALLKPPYEAESRDGQRERGNFAAAFQLAVDAKLADSEFHELIRKTKADAKEIGRYRKRYYRDDGSPEQYWRFRFNRHFDSRASPSAVKAG